MSLSEQSPDSSQHTVFLRIIWVVFARYLEHCGKSICIRVHSVSYPLCDLASKSAKRVLLQRHSPGAYVLVDEQYSYVIPAMGVLIKGLLDGGRFCFGVDDEEILLGVRRLCHMLSSQLQRLNSLKQRVLRQYYSHQSQLVAGP